MDRESQDKQEFTHLVYDFWQFALVFFIVVGQFDLGTADNKAICFRDLSSSTSYTIRTYRFFIKVCFGNSL